MLLASQVKGRRTRSWSPLSSGYVTGLSSGRSEDQKLVTLVQWLCYWPLKWKVGGSEAGHLGPVVMLLVLSSGRLEDRKLVALVQWLCYWPLKWKVGGPEAGHLCPVVMLLASQVEGRRIRSWPPLSSGYVTGLSSGRSEDQKLVTLVQWLCYWPLKWKVGGSEAGHLGPDGYVTGLSSGRSEDRKLAAFFPSGPRWQM